MNWGYKIMIVFSLFVTGIIVLVVKSSQQKQQLVTTGYYEKELVYQQQIDAQNNYAMLSIPVEATYTDETIFINFPPEMKGKEVSVNAHLYCPADEKQDRKAVQQTTDARLLLKVPGIKTGKYYIKLSWQAGGKQYYNELELFVP